MSYQATVVEILVAGPGDVQEARRTVVDAIEAWNQHNAHHLGLVMRPITWETDTYPELGDDPQAIINKQLANRCAALIAVFATRLGTATPRGASGTAEEVGRFESDGKPVGVYFSEGQVELSGIDTSQLEALRDYKKSLGARGLYRGYKSMSDFRRLIDQHLSQLGHYFRAQQQVTQVQHVGTELEFDPTETDMRVLAVLGRMMTENVTSHVNSLYLQDETELSGVSQEDIFESLRVLKSRGLITGADNPGQGRWEVGLSSSGFETWLLNFTRNYEHTQHKIAVAIARDDIRDPNRIPEATGVPAMVVEHVLQRWAARNLVIVNRLYDGVRIDRFSPEIQRLADRDSDRTLRPTGLNPSDKATDEGPRFRTVDQPIGVDVVALSDFGGEIGDPVAAAVRVGGWTVLRVVAPSERASWEPQVEAKFRSEVHRLASVHHLLDRQGEVRVVFDPSQSSTETRDETIGELVERRR